MGIIGRIRAWNRGRGISIVIPFRAPADPCSQRIKNFEWVVSYWQAQLPGAEIVIGRDNDPCRPFSKAVAINEGVAHTSGDILVIVDADCYIPSEVVLKCAHEIRAARRRERKLWFVPYRHFWRLTEEASWKVLCSPPRHPYEFPCPPLPCDVIDCTGSSMGHWYGAMIQILPREAFHEMGGWDERFCGWGGEDHSAMRCVDTLYWPHKTVPGQVLHLWHPMNSRKGEKNFVHWSERMWDGQAQEGVNDRLTTRYTAAHGDRVRMRALADEWKNK